MRDIQLSLTQGPYLVSACLTGICCRYDGETKPCREVIEFLQGKTFIPVCPEQLGGLSTPRSPAFFRGELLFDAQENNVTPAFLKGAEETLKIARLTGVRTAILKERSPSCGTGFITAECPGGLQRIPGMGVTARRLLEYGIDLFSEEVFQ